MTLKKILICGERSYAARGLYELLISKGFLVHCFSRGEENRNGNFISGQVERISSNKLLDPIYDVVINFILLKGESLCRNLNYIESLLDFCVAHQVRRYLQISSVSVYENYGSTVDESTKIRSYNPYNNNYASLKANIDHVIKEYCDLKGITYSFIRPGFIVNKNEIPSLKGLAIRLVFSHVLLGNRKTTFSYVDRSVFHKAILNIVLSDEFSTVYLILNNTTKYFFLRGIGIKRVFFLPKFFVVPIAYFLNEIGLLGNSKAKRILGLFRRTCYDQSETEWKLKMSFCPGSVGIIGAGTYGCYIANALSDRRERISLTIFEAGNRKIKNETEIGFRSNLMNNKYSGLSKGRFFGLGGSSARWGGQLLLFSKTDFHSPNEFLSGIIELNRKFKTLVMKRFGLKNMLYESPLFPDMILKTGIWLGYFNRNLFNYFRISKKENILIKKNCRVIRLYIAGKKIMGFEYLDNGKKKHAIFDFYYLACGAFEANRLILSSDMSNGIKKIYFSDHVEQKVFLIKSRGSIGNIDLKYRLLGTSLKTKRLTGEIEGVSYYSMPNFNSDFPFFLNIKQLLFKRKYSLKILKDIISDLPSAILFLYYLIAKREVFVFEKKWILIINMENSAISSSINLSKDKDKYGEYGLDVSFEISEESSAIYKRIKERLRKLLIENNVDFEDISEKAVAEKYEDTYHPYGMFLSQSPNVDSYLNHFSNMLVVNTGILPRAGGLNTTATLFPIIEEYIERKYEAVRPSNTAI